MMTLQTKPEKWACLPTAFAIALDLPVAEVIKATGHDGSKCVNQGVNVADSDPTKYAGWHVQELIRVARAHGFAVTPIELYPVSQTGGTTFTIHFADFGLRSNKHQFDRFLQSTRGVLTGVVVCDDKKWGHAVAYDRGLFHDPDGKSYLDLPFTPQCLWVFDKLAYRDGAPDEGD